MADEPLKLRPMLAESAEQIKRLGLQWCKAHFIENTREVLCEDAVKKYAENPLGPDVEEELRRDIFCAQFIQDVTTESVRECQVLWGNPAKTEPEDVDARERNFRGRSPQDFSAASLLLKEFDARALYVPPAKPPSQLAAAARAAAAGEAGATGRGLMEIIGREEAVVGVAPAAPAATARPPAPRSPAGRRPAFFQRAPAPTGGPALTRAELDELLQDLLLCTAECMRKRPGPAASPVAKAG